MAGGIPPPTLALPYRGIGFRVGDAELVSLWQDILACPERLILGLIGTLLGMTWLILGISGMLR